MSDLWRGRSVLGRWGLLVVLALNLAIGGIGSLIAIPKVSAASADIVISQVYGGGGNTGAAYTNDFVELFNLGSVAVDVSTWSVQYASSTAAFNASNNNATNGINVTNLTGTIRPGHYYLISLNSNNTTIGSPLPTADVVNNGVGLSNNNGKVALVTNQTALTCGTTANSCLPNAAIEDFVGYGTANNYEGTGAASAPANATSVARTNVCADSDANNTDFAVINPPTPRNSATTAVSCSAVSPSPSASTSPSPQPLARGSLAATYTLPDQRLGVVQNAALPGSITNDRNFNLGGIGSDLWHRPGDPADEFWMITDRGPNGQIRVNGANRRTFPVPEFDPLILHVRVGGSAITILQTVPILTPTGQPVTGLSNLASHDETPYDYTAQTPLSFNPNGLDSEGLVRTADGTFWVAEEYSPSILKIGADGKVIRRFVPAGLDTTGTAYPVSATLPAILAKRKINRGFEGLGLTPDGRTLYAIVQSPLSNPDKATGEASRQTRIITIDTASEQVTGEYVYRFEVVNTLDSQTTTQDDMKSSALVVVDPKTLLVEERTDRVARLYRVDLTGAQNILGGKYDDLTTTPSLEALTDPSPPDVTILPKTLLVDLAAISGVPGKVEGVALVNCTTIAIANDNDFNIGTFDSNGNNVNASPVNSVIQLIALDTPITSGCVNTSAFIRTIQGVGHVSPLNGQPVTGVPGIVTALTATGFYLQDANPDADPRTSEGIFVFTRTAPTVAVGDALLVSGTVKRLPCRRQRRHGQPDDHRDYLADVRHAVAQRRPAERGSDRYRRSHPPDRDDQGR